MSTPLPAPNGTMRRTVCVGHAPSDGALLHAQRPHVMAAKATRAVVERIDPLQRPAGVFTFARRGLSMPGCR